MVELPHAGAKIAAEVVRIASVPASIEQRAQLLLEPLGRLVPFQGAWISLLNPEAPEQLPLVCHGYPNGLRSYMGGPAGVAEIEMLGLDRSGATRLSDLPIDLQEVPSWAEYLAPAGFRGGLVAALFTPDGRYLGMLGLNTESVAHPTVAARDLMTMLAPMIAHALDPMRSLTAAVKLVRNAQAGIVLTRAGNALPLPGLPTHALLTPGSDVLIVGLERLTQGDRHATFLWRCPGDEAAGRHVRVTVLACPADVPPRHLAAVVAVSPAGDLHGLTGLELVILGLLVEDWSDRRIAAALGLPLAAVTEHVEHVLAKLGVPTRLLATLRALRLGLYVPPPGSTGLITSASEGNRSSPHGRPGPHTDEPVRDVQATARRQHRGGGTGRRAQLLPDVLEVSRGGPRGDGQPGGDALIGVSLDHQAEDDQLPVRQSAKVPRGRDQDEPYQVARRVRWTGEAGNADVALLTVVRGDRAEERRVPDPVVQTVDRCRHDAGGSGEEGIGRHSGQWGDGASAVDDDGGGSAVDQPREPGQRVHRVQDGGDRGRDHADHVPGLSGRLGDRVRVQREHAQVAVVLSDQWDGEASAESGRPPMFGPARQLGRVRRRVPQAQGPASLQQAARLRQLGQLLRFHVRAAVPIVADRGDRDVAAPIRVERADPPGRERNDPFHRTPQESQVVCRVVAGRRHPVDLCRQLQRHRQQLGHSLEPPHDRLTPDRRSPA